MSILLLSNIDTAVPFSAFCHETLLNLSWNITDINIFSSNVALLLSLEIKFSDNLTVLKLLWNTGLFNCSVIRNSGTQLVFIPILQMLILVYIQGGNTVEQIQIIEMETD